MNRKNRHRILNGIKPKKTISRSNQEENLTIDVVVDTDKLAQDLQQTVGISKLAKGLTYEIIWGPELPFDNKEFVAYTIPNYGRIPDKTIIGDTVYIPFIKDGE